MDYDFKHFENSLGFIYCSVRYHPRLNMIAVNWKGTATAEKIRVVKDEVISLIRKHNCLFLMNDLQDFFTASSEILTDLIRSKWDNEVYDAGARYIVHILKPEMEIPLLSDDESERKKFFYTKFDALDWIKSQQAI